MIVAVNVEKMNGTFSATVPGIPAIHVDAATADRAVAEVTEQLRSRMSAGQLVFVDIGLVGISGLVGKYKDDPTLREICEEAYRQRDAELASTHESTPTGPAKAKRPLKGRQKTSR